jgi:hypothetical protein
LAESVVYSAQGALEVPASQLLQGSAIDRFKVEFSCWAATCSDKNQKAEQQSQGKCVPLIAA